MRPDARALAVYLLGVFLGALDTGVLGPAFPLIARAFAVSMRWNAWTVTVYTVAYVASTGLAGAAGDRFGRRRVFVLGLAAFALASAVAALSGGVGFWAFLAARGLQGAGAGAVYPNAQAEGVAAFPVERRGMALGIFGAVFGLAAVLGPNVGGALAQFVGWPAIFAVNVPLAVVAVGLTLRLPPERVAPARAAAPGPAVLGMTAAPDSVPPVPAPGRAVRALPDALGAAGFAVGLAGLLLALAAGSPWRWVFLACGAGAALLWAQRQRTAVVPFLDLRPLSNAGGVALIAGAAVIGLDLSASIFVPSLAQARLGMGVFASGVALMPAALSGAVLAGVAGLLVDRVGPRLVLQVGLLAAVVGGLILARADLALGGFVVAMLFLGLATAFTVGAPINRLALALYQEEQSGLALALIAVFRAVGLASGPVLLTLAEAGGGFPAMFRTVAAASLVGAALFFVVPDVRPTGAPRRRSGPRPAAEGVRGRWP